jgi:hypothetical protein
MEIFISDGRLNMKKKLKVETALLLLGFNLNNRLVRQLG